MTLIADWYDTRARYCVQRHTTTPKVLLSSSAGSVESASTSLPAALASATDEANAQLKCLRNRPKLVTIDDENSALVSARSWLSAAASASGSVRCEDMLSTPASFSGCALPCRGPAMAAIASIPGRALCTESRSGCRFLQTGTCRAAEPVPAPLLLGSHLDMLEQLPDRNPGCMQLVHVEFFWCP